MELHKKKALWYISFLTILIVSLWFCHLKIKIDNQNKTYLLNSASCCIRHYDPFSEDVMRLIQRPNVEPCDRKHLLTKVVQLANGSFALIVQKQYIKEYQTLNEQNLVCCYEVVKRVHEFKSKKSISMSECFEFKKATVLGKSVEFVLVRCVLNRPHFNSSMVVYKDAHAVVPVKSNVKIRLDEFKSKRADNKMDTPPSVLMIGIDSVSRLNYRRNLPLTLQHLQSTGWIELNVYNKVADNTYPNMMALLGGYDVDVANSICRRGLDKCPLIWRDFQENGYVTVYCEDTTYSIFNYNKKVVLKQPTDYYTHPYFLAMELSLPKTSRADLDVFYCLGSITATERLFKYLAAFATTFKNDPFFGFFFITALSHNLLEMPQSTDLIIKKTFQELSHRGILNNSIIFFFSDHGLRFGKIRHLHTGWLEDRLPFMHIWIPEKIRENHYALFNNLVENSNKLTSTFDLHMTLYHILSLSRNQTERPIKKYPDCKSIFKPIPFDRPCAEAGINAHWCACEMYENINIDDADVMAAAEFVVPRINTFYDKEYVSCVNLTLSRVTFALINKSTNVSSRTYYYRLGLQTLPDNAIFESTVKVNEERKFEIQGISRTTNSSAVLNCELI